MALVLSAPIDTLFRRRSDLSYIVECDRHFHKKVSLYKAQKFASVRREEGIEKHYSWHCKDCHYLIGYQCFDTAPITTAAAGKGIPSDDMIVGPGTRGKDEVSLQEDKDKRKHFYIRALQPKGEATLVANA